ncbi:hypothetical protein HZC30_06640 [Candidatus Woesearchaeota archaeon]|nr:hypothetical protein [Candidatus Woesearchaeota archaeon]
MTTSNTTAGIRAAIAVSLVLALSSLLFAQSPSSSDPWSDDNFEQSFRDNPATGFAQNPDKAWEALGSNPSLMSNTEVLTTAFAEDPARAVNVLNKNPQLLDDVFVLETLDTQVQGNIKLLNDNPAVKEKWLQQKFGIGMISPATIIKSYDGATIETETASFEPEKLPKDVKYKLQQDGSLKAEGGYEGSFYGKVEFKDGVLITDNKFVNSDKNNFACTSGCSIQISKAGLVTGITGEGKVNEIPVKDLESVSVLQGAIFATPNQKDSKIGGIGLFGIESIAYNPVEKKFYGENFMVESTSPDAVFEGKKIKFQDNEGKAIATLFEGKTVFVGSEKECSGKKSSCISADKSTKTIFVSARENSNLVVDAGKEYDALRVGDITDESKVILLKDNKMVATFNQNGAHPRRNPQDLGMNIESLEPDGKTQKIYANGYEMCDDKRCTKTNFGCVKG